MPITIVQKENPVLRAIAKEVPISDITKPKIKKVIRDMKKALATQSDGVAIAAPQIGESYRIFVVSGKIFEETWQRGQGSPASPGAEGDQGLPDGEVAISPDLVFINPVITKVSKTKRWMHEGCLSVRPLWGEVHRSTQASIVAYDERGTKFARGASGLLAHIFQHETDHLDGTLFIDKARNVAPGIVPETIAKSSKPKVKS